MERFSSPSRTVSKSRINSAKPQNKNCYYYYSIGPYNRIWSVSASEVGMPAGHTCTAWWPTLARAQIYQDVQWTDTSSMLNTFPTGASHVGHRDPIARATRRVRSIPCVSPCESRPARSVALSGAVAYPDGRSTRRNIMQALHSLHLN